jgi:hypothetical protein
VQEDMSEFDLVVLEDNDANERLKVGDVGTILTVYSEGKAFEVEFVTLTGELVAVETLLPHQIRTVRASEVMAVRDTTTKAATNS